MPFGEVLIRARENAGLKQKDVVSLIKNKDGNPISAAFLSDLERNLRKPTSYLIDQLAIALKISPFYLYHCAGKLPPAIASHEISYEREKEAEKLYRELEKSLKNLSS